MRGFGAKDDDRDRHVALIEAAYADGQIGDADRELRVSRARSAVTLDELLTLTRDLRPPAHGPAPVQPAPVPPRSARPRPASDRGTRGAVAIVLLAGVGVVAIGVVAAFVGLVGPSLPGGDDSASGRSAPAQAEVSRAASFEMTAPDLRAFVRAYQKEFGARGAFEAAFYPERVVVQVPVPVARPRYEQWTWDGAWHADAPATRRVGSSDHIDLRDVDVRRLFANIRSARKTLRVEDGEMTHVLVTTGFDDQPGVSIYIGNGFGESGYLRTTLAGDLVRRFPYQP